jgi:hypothetical protein
VVYGYLIFLKVFFAGVSVMTGALFIANKINASGKYLTKLVNYIKIKCRKRLFLVMDHAKTSKGIMIQR